MFNSTKQTLESGFLGYQVRLSGIMALYPADGIMLQLLEQAQP